MAKEEDGDESLKRLGGGRWQTRDERFTIEPQSGTWVVVDGEQTDDLGLPLIRGPFGSLGAAKEAIATARTSGAPVKPLPRPSKTAPAAKTPQSKAPKAEASPKTKAKPEPEPEPRWLSDLQPAARRRARDTIKRLTEAGASDPEGITRRDLVGDVPAVATFALNRRLDDLGPDATPSAVVDLLTDGRDDDLGVRWRVVDDDGRPIMIDRGPAGRRRRS